MDTHAVFHPPARRRAPSFARLRRRGPLVALIVGAALLITPMLALLNVSAAGSFASPAFQAQWQAGEAITPNFWGRSLWHGRGSRSRTSRRRAASASCSTSTRRAWS